MDWRDVRLKIKVLHDGRAIGCAIYEITGIPNIDESSVAEASVSSIEVIFQQTIKEFHKLGSDGRCCAELLWLTEMVEGQSTHSRVRLFLVVRQIDSNVSMTERKIASTTSLFITNLSNGQYELQEVSFAQLREGLKKIDSCNLHGIVKSEKCIGTMTSAYPYYFCDVLPSGNTDNFASLLAELSQHDGCAVSFQLFPTSFSLQEIYVLREQASILSRMADGIMWGPQMLRDQTAKMPQRVMAYYADHAASPLFQYNIFVFGERSACSAISAKIISLLQAGKTSMATADCACVDLSRENVSIDRDFLIYPWNINNRLIYAYRNRKLIQSLQSANVLKRLPYIVTAEEAASFFRLPLYEKGMAALKENSTHQYTEQFDERVIDSRGIQLGVLSGNQEVKLYCPANQFTKHAMIVGMPGSGKTTFSIGLLLQFARRGIPFLAIEPTKSEYRAMIDVLPDLQIFTPGNNSASPFIINPFLPPSGIRLEQYVPSLVSAFEAAFDMPSPLDVLFLKAVRQCYTEHGWKDYSTKDDPDVRVFGLRELIRCFRRLVRESTYSKEVKGNLESAGIFRLMNLIEQNGNIYDTIHTVPIEDLLSHPTVLELNAIDNTEQKALIMALLLINICVYTKNKHTGDGKLKNILLMDEAHVLLGNHVVKSDVGADSRSMTIKALQDLIAEIRSYGTGIIIADQRPSQIGREIIANTELKIVFRLVESSEKALVSDSTSMDEQDTKQLGRLDVGEAYCYYSFMRAPYRLVTPDTRADEHIRLDVSNDEITRKMRYWDGRQTLLKPYVECEWCKSCQASCDFRLRAQADYYASRLFSQNAARITDQDVLEKHLVSMGALLQNVVTGLKPDQRRQLINCCRIKLLRKVELEKDITIDPRRMKLILTKD